MKRPYSTNNHGNKDASNVEPGNYPFDGVRIKQFSIATIHNLDSRMSTVCVGFQDIMDQFPKRNSSHDLRTLRNSSPLTKRSYPLRNPDSAVQGFQ